MTWPVDTPAELDHARRLGVNGVIGKDLTLLGEVLESRSRNQHSGSAQLPGGQVA
jgi:hypothetical protein